MTQNRRDFIKTAALATIGSGIAANKLFAETPGFPFSINRSGKNAKLKLRFQPHNLQINMLTVATYSRTTTPDVQRLSTMA